MDSLKWCRTSEIWPGICRINTENRSYCVESVMSLGWILAWTQTRHIVPKLKKSNVSLAPPLFVWILCGSVLNINVFDMYGVQTPVVSAPLTPKAPLNAYIWGRKFETYNSVRTVLRYHICTVQIFQFEFVETRAKLKWCVILRGEIDGDWLKKNAMCWTSKHTRLQPQHTRSQYFPEWTCRNRKPMCFGFDT